MTKTTFFSPSFRGDLDRFLLLRTSIARFYRGAARHVVAVPRADVAMFREALLHDTAEVIEQERFVPEYFYPKLWVRAMTKLFPAQSWRLSSVAGRRGWIIQQIVKLSLPEIVHDGAVAILDSDIVFLRDFDDGIFGAARGGRRLLLRDEPKTESGKHRKHIARAREILGLPEGSTEHHYMAYPTIWYMDWVTQLRAHIEAKHHQPWQRALFEADVFSEYSLYGVYVDEVVRPPGLVHKRRFHHVVWDLRSYEAFMRQDFIPPIAGTSDEPLTLVIQSNLGISPAAYRAHVEELWHGARPAGS